MKNMRKGSAIFLLSVPPEKTAQEMLTELRIRLQNSPEVEIEIAADEQNKITKLRIEKLLDD